MTNGEADTQPKAANKQLSEVRLSPIPNSLQHLLGILIQSALSRRLDIQWKRWSQLANHMSELVPQRHRQLKLAMMLGLFAVEAQEGFE